VAARGSQSAKEYLVVVHWLAEEITETSAFVSIEEVANSQ
jgi:hypothetical protein